MSKFGRVRLVLALLSVAVITTIGILYCNTTPSTWYGYVASCDRRVHNFNLDTGELIWTSDEFEWMGQPMGLDIDRDRSILYIASGSYLPRQDYIPVVAVILNDTFDIVFSSTLYSNSMVSLLLMELGSIQNLTVFTSVTSVQMLCKPFWIQELEKSSACWIYRYSSITNFLLKVIFWLKFFHLGLECLGMNLESGREELALGICVPE